MIELAVAAAVFAVALVLIYVDGWWNHELVSCYDMSEGDRNAHLWGYTDTRFEFDADGSVRVTGSRYPMAGYKMPYFIPFVEEILGMQIRAEDAVTEVNERVIPEPRVDEAFLSAVAKHFGEGQISLDEDDRLIHSHGQLSVDEIYRLLYIGAPARAVDVVAFPQSEEEVKHLVHIASEHDVCLVPYGGGTNVSGALTCPAEEQRTIVSVDMGRMKRILDIDEDNLLARVEAGISGKELERELNARGYTSGHEPDSVELSTLGGWISTNASGMKKNKYGNIDDIVLEATLVSPTGEIETKQATPRNSTGVQPRGLLFGSEGNLGIITKAVIKIHPEPPVRRYGSVVFPSFDGGVEFLRQLRQEGVLPASIRLVMNREFQFGQALKPAEGSLKRAVTAIQKFVLLKIKRFDPLKMAACTIVMEGTSHEVRHQKKVIFRTAGKFGGVSAGAKNGQRGYMLTFSIAYIRDFFNKFNVLGETFETSVPWNRIHQVTGAARRTLDEEAQSRGVHGKPYFSYRIPQTYHTGVCIYFTMGLSGKGLEKPDEVFHEIEQRIRQSILDNGGSLSHHHGVGKIRQAFLPQIQTENAIRVLRETKKAMDPGNVFGIRNGIFTGRD